MRGARCERGWEDGRRDVSYYFEHWDGGVKWK